MFSYTVKTYPIRNPRGKMLAYASLVIDGTLEITGFKIFEGQYGLFVKPPQKKGTNKDGEEEWFDDVRFIGDQCKEVREEVYSTVISNYNTNTPQTSRENTAEIQSDINETMKSNNNSRKPLW